MLTASFAFGIDVNEAWVLIGLSASGVCHDDYEGRKEGDSRSFDFCFDHDIRHTKYDIRHAYISFHSNIPEW